MGYAGCSMAGTSAQLGRQAAVAVAAEAGEAVQVEYPDHRWIAQSTWHELAGRFAADALQQYFRPRRDVLVASELVVYYRRGDNRAWLQPDVMVARGVPCRSGRSVYKLWQEGKAPDFVLEVASPSTASRDEGPKALEYAAIEVREYWRLDPNPARRLMERALRGYCWQAGRYEPVAAVGQGKNEMLRSEMLGLDLRAAGDDTMTFLVFRDPRTGQEFDGRLETAEQQRRLAEARASAAREEANVAKVRERAAREEARELKRRMRELTGQAPPKE